MNRHAVMKPRELVPAEVLATLAALRAERDALREENERLKAGGWQPIETAPGFRLYQNEDPIAVLLCAENEAAVIGYVALRRDGTRRGVVNGLYGKRYTHWMPLPKGPQS